MLSDTLQFIVKYLLPPPPFMQRWMTVAQILTILTTLLRSAHTRGHVAGTCRGEEFHSLFTRRGMLRGWVSWSVHTEGLVAGTCRDFVFWLVYFPKCRGDMSHEPFTRGDLAFNGGVTLFCRRDMYPQFKLIWIQGTCRGDKISFPQQDFSWKSSVHTMGFVAGTKSPWHVPATCPLVWADLYRNMARGRGGGGGRLAEGTILKRTMDEAWHGIPKILLARTVGTISANATVEFVDSHKLHIVFRVGQLSGTKHWQETQKTLAETRRRETYLLCCCCMVCRCCRWHRCCDRCTDILGEQEGQRFVPWNPQFARRLVYTAQIRGNAT